jgi:hypothetical protein
MRREASGGQCGAKSERFQNEPSLGHGSSFPRMDTTNKRAAADGASLSETDRKTHATRKPLKKDGELVIQSLLCPLPVRSG